MQDIVVFTPLGKVCSRCEEHFPYAGFRKDRFRKDGLTSACRKCLAAQRRLKMRTDPVFRAKQLATTSKCRHKWHKKDPAVDRAWNIWTSVKSHKKGAAPKWVKFPQISEIYKKAAAAGEGYRVKFMYPIWGGETVSGLLVPENLMIVNRKTHPVLRAYTNSHDVRAKTMLRRAMTRLRAP